MLLDDVIVRACGWRHNTSIYHPSVLPTIQSQRKYPQLTPEYESVNVPGMYFCGTLAHGKDWKRAAGGFIHGFRYTARALHHILEVKYENGGWAGATEYKVPEQNADLARHILRRINEASGPYQMFCDCTVNIYHISIYRVLSELIACVFRHPWRWDGATATGTAGKGLDARVRIATQMTFRGEFSSIWKQCVFYPDR